MTIQNSGIYRNLLTQLDKVVRHSKQGSYKTRERYHSACKRFCGFLADHYRLEKLANIAPKHIEAYVKHMQDKGLSVSTIKTDLTAIRFYHDQMANAKHTLPDNDKLDLKRRKFGGVDRTWSHGEFKATSKQPLRNPTRYGKLNKGAKNGETNNILWSGQAT